MATEFLSILIFAFSSTLLILGMVTWWIERGRKRQLGLLLIVSALMITVGYAFLGSRFSIALFGRLIVAVDLPRLWSTAIIYTIGVLTGIGLAGSLFLWMSGRLIKLRPTRLERQMAMYVGIILVVALLISLVAVYISR